MIQFINCCVCLIFLCIRSGNKRGNEKKLRLLDYKMKSGRHHFSNIHIIDRETIGNYVYYLLIHFVRIQFINSNVEKQNVTFRVMFLIQEYIQLRFLLRMVEDIKMIFTKLPRRMERKWIPENILMNLLNVILILIVSLIDKMKIISVMKNCERRLRRTIMDGSENLKRRTAVESTMIAMTSTMIRIGFNAAKMMIIPKTAPNRKILRISRWKLRVVTLVRNPFQNLNARKQSAKCQRNWKIRYNNSKADTDIDGVSDGS